MVVVVELVVVVLVAAGGGDVGPGSVVGEGRDGEVRGDGVHRYAVVGGTGESGRRGVLVARGEDRNTAFDGPVWRSGVVDEVVECGLFQGAVLLPLLLCGESGRVFVSVGPVRSGPGPADHLFRQRDGLSVGTVCALNGAVGSCGLYLSEPGEACDDLIDAVILAEPYDIPEVETGFAGLLFGAFVDGEHPFEFAVAEQVEEFVHRGDAAPGGGSAASGLGESEFIEHVADGGVEFHDDFAGHFSGLLGFGPAAGRGLGELLGGAGDQRQCAESR